MTSNTYCRHVLFYLLRTLHRLLNGSNRCRWPCPSRDCLFNVPGLERTITSRGKGQTIILPRKCRANNTADRPTRRYFAYRFVVACTDRHWARFLWRPSPSPLSSRINNKAEYRLQEQRQWWRSSSIDSNKVGAGFGGEHWTTRKLAAVVYGRTWWTHIWSATRWLTVPIRNSLNYRNEWTTELWKRIARTGKLPMIWLMLICSPSCHDLDRPLFYFHLFKSHFQKNNKIVVKG